MTGVCAGNLPPENAVGKADASERSQRRVRGAGSRATCLPSHTPSSEAGPLPRERHKTPAVHPDSFPSPRIARGLAERGYPLLKSCFSPRQAVGLSVRFIKLGGPSRGEWVMKYNRLLTIEEELVQNGTLGMHRFLLCFPSALNQRTKIGRRGIEAPLQEGRGTQRP